jgi:hypothetical protein
MQWSGGIRVNLVVSSLMRRECRMNLESGLRKALKYSALGFAISAGTLAMLAIYHFTFHDIHPLDRQNDLARLPDLILVPSFGIAVLFGLSAFGSFTPKRGMKFIRSLTVISGATAIAVFVTREPVLRKTIDSNSWIETAIPIVVALSATIAVLVINKWSSTSDEDELGYRQPANRSS